MPTLNTSIGIGMFSEKEPVLTFPVILNNSKYSSRTLRRRMHALGVLSSYNANSKFYTLPKFANFDNYGLWEYNKIYFSKYEIYSLDL